MWNRKKRDKGATRWKIMVHWEWLFLYHSLKKFFSTMLLWLTLLPNSLFSLNYIPTIERQLWKWCCQIFSLSIILETIENANLGPHLRPTESKTLDAGLRNGVLASLWRKGTRQCVKLWWPLDFFINFTNCRWQYYHTLSNVRVNMPSLGYFASVKSLI